MFYNTESNTNPTLDRIFGYEETITLTEQEEADLITLAQGGDSEAFMYLMRVYGRTLRKQSNRASKTLDMNDRSYSVEEARDLAVMAFTEVVMTHDVHSEEYNARIAGRLATELTETYGFAHAGSKSLTVSKRHYSRYVGIMKKADQNLDAAYELAVEAPGMDPDTFLAIHRAVQGTSLDAALTGEDGSIIETANARPVVTLVDDAYTEAEDAVLIDAAFAAVNDEEERILSLHYGFRGVQRDDLGVNYAQGQVIPDAAIASVIGSSQQTVNRKRSAGLAKMRKALAVSPAPSKKK